MPQTPSEMPCRAAVTACQETLRGLALNDERFVASNLGIGYGTVEVSQLDTKTHSLVQLAAALAIDVTMPAAYHTAVGFAPADVTGEAIPPQIRRESLQGLQPPRTGLARIG